MAAIWKSKIRNSRVVAPGRLRAFVLSVAFAVLATIAHAQVESWAPGERVPSRSGTLYADLIRLMGVALTQEDGIYRVGGTLRLRHIGGGEETADLRETVLRSVAVLPLAAGAKPRLALLLDLGRAMDSAEGFAILALVDPAGRRLLDAANVAHDRDTSFLPPSHLAAGGAGDVLITASRHTNSNQAYQTTALIAVRRDRLSLIDTVFTLNDSGCGYERRQILAITKPDRARPPAIRVAVTEQTQVAEPACEGGQPPAARRRTMSTAYRWDEASRRWVRTSDALERLARETQERF
jgi:hypothetical protein